MNFWKSLFAMAIILGLASCRQEVDEEVLIDPVNDATSWVNDYNPENQTTIANVAGYVVNENKKPAVGATVNLGDRTTQTNEFGYFHFPQATLNQKGTTVQIQQDGYFPASRTFFPLPNSDQRLKIQLVPMTFSHSFNAGLGATIISNGGASVSFPANAIMDEETGTLYQGEVQVASHWLDPTELSTIDQMPGSLHGLTPDLNPGALATYGMIAVELQSPDGRPLNLHGDAKATLNMPVPESLQADAPPTIPLWYYHEDLGIWVEDGTAMLENGMYQGQVSHFSWWNCDFFLETVYVSFRLLDPLGNPLDQITAQLTLASGAISSASVTDADGFYSAPVPANEVFTLQLATTCGQIIYEQELGPFSNNSSIGTIIVDNPNGVTIEANGTAVNCALQPLENGYYILIEYGPGEAQYLYFTEPEFSIYEWACFASTPAILRIFDLENDQSSAEYTIPINQPTDLGNISTCEDGIQTFLELTVNGQNALYETIAFETGPDTTNMTAYNEPVTNEEVFYANLGGSGAGDYSSNNLHVTISHLANDWSFPLIGPDGIQSYDTFIISEYGDQPGDVIAGNFSGTLYNASQEQWQEVMGTFVYVVP